jgi:hypothetical protein
MASDFGALADVLRARSDVDLLGDFVGDLMGDLVGSLVDDLVEDFDRSSSSRFVVLLAGFSVVSVGFF